MLIMDLLLTQRFISLQLFDFYGLWIQFHFIVETTLVDVQLTIMSHILLISARTIHVCSQLFSSFASPHCTFPGGINSKGYFEQ